MYQRPWFGQTLVLVSGLLLLGSSGCSSSPPVSTTSPVPVSTSVAAPAAPAPAAVANVPSEADQAQTYNQGLEKAKSAKNISQSALTEDDWNLVVSRWQQAIQLLKTLPPSSAYAALAKAKLPEFEQALATAQKQVTQAKAASNQKGGLGALASSEPLNVTSAIAAAPDSGQVFRAPIKRRAGGTPIIDVTFNGNQTFEMIVDTGASGTVITEEMAAALNVQIVGKTKVNTASQAGVEVPLAFVKSIAVGRAVVKDVIVAIGSQALDIGLLGHDFFSDYDVTVKQDVVEFRKR